MKNLKDQLLSDGYIVVKNFIDPSLIESIDRKRDLLIPHRGHGVDNKYWPQDKIKDCPELALWWSQQLNAWPEVIKIEEKLCALLLEVFYKPTLYVSDVITNTSKNQYIKPHIDSPYRFDKWHDSFDLLGVQCIFPLCKFTKENGGTGLLPNSHKKNWVVKDSYAGVYNEEFLAGVVQPIMDIGDMLMYHPRVLHSTMPNKTTEPRRALLIHITEETMIDQMRSIDTIFTGLPSFR